jgi:hypothetical protein
VQQQQSLPKIPAQCIVKGEHVSLSHAHVLYVRSAHWLSVSGRQPTVAENAATETAASTDEQLQQSVPDEPALLQERRQRVNMVVAVKRLAMHSISIVSVFMSMRQS